VSTLSELWDEPSPDGAGCTGNKNSHRFLLPSALQARPLSAPGANLVSLYAVRMRPAHPARHLLRAKDLIDARYREQLDVKAIARAARLSPAHFSREFRREFGESPHRYLLTRRLERAAALLRATDRSVTDVCLAVGLRSLGSFTTSFRRTYGMTPTEYRAAHPPAVLRARVPTCVLMAWGRPETARLEKTAA